MYTTSMSMITASRCSDGLLLVSDGKARFIENGKERTDYHTCKINMVTDFVYALRTVYATTEFETQYCDVYQELNDVKPLSVERVAKSLRNKLTIVHQSEVDNGGKYLVILAGYDIDSEGKPTDKRIYEIVNNHEEEKIKPCHYHVALGGGVDINNSQLALNRIMVDHQPNETATNNVLHHISTIRTAETKDSSIGGEFFAKLLNTNGINDVDPKVIEAAESFVSMRLKWAAMK